MGRSRIHGDCSNYPVLVPDESTFTYEQPEAQFITLTYSTMNRTEYASACISARADWDTKPRLDF